MPRSITQHRPRKFLLLLLLVLGIRGLLVPLHLAHEDHLAAGAHLLAHAPEDTGHAGHEHHQDDHPPHPASEHSSDILAQRTPCQQSFSNLLALPLAANSQCLAALPEAWVTAQPYPPPPERHAPLALRLRGPPAAS